MDPIMQKDVTRHVIISGMYNPEVQENMHKVRSRFIHYKDNELFTLEEVIQTYEEDKDLGSHLYDLIQTTNDIFSISVKSSEPQIDSTWFMKQSVQRIELRPDFEFNQNIAADLENGVLPGFLKPYPEYYSEHVPADPELDHLEPIAITEPDDLNIVLDNEDPYKTAVIKRIAFVFLQVTNYQTMAITYKDFVGERVNLLMTKV